jgi:protein O-GlcNAc transferase
VRLEGHRISASDDLFRDAVALYKAGQLSEAEVACRNVLNGHPAHFDALHTLGVICGQRGDFVSAERFIALALKVDGNSVIALTNYGNALQELGYLDRALVACEKAIALRPNFARAFFIQGVTYQKLDRLNSALSSYDTAIKFDTNNAAALRERGNVLRLLGRFREALGSYERAIAIAPNDAVTHGNRAAILQYLKQFDQALASYDKAIALNPIAEFYYHRGILLQDFGQLEDGDASFIQALAIKPDYAEAASRVAELAGRLCDWTHRRAQRQDLIERSLSGQPLLPWSMLTLVDSLEAQSLAAVNFTRRYHPAQPRLLQDEHIAQTSRIRIAYLSGDFYSHAVAYLMAELFERHNKEKFEIYAISWSPSDGSPIQKRLEGAFEHFIDVQDKSDDYIANLLCTLQIHIAVDLKGYTGGCRPGIFVRHPAPIAVSYLGYPGTLGAEYIDYLIADRYLIPEQSRRFYSENIVYLPDSYLVNDSKRVISEPPPTRVEAGLPNDAFVFCCFNNSYKINPEMFDVWMRLLQNVERSVLWLSVRNETAIQNLVKEAEIRGIAPDRLRFAPFAAEQEKHLSRIRLADLFLDTLPYNAHTTASDALWAGVPVLTCSGESFAARVAGSLLQAIGLPELITHKIEDYEALALSLAHDPIRLAELRYRLSKNRMTYPLFDCRRFCRHIEASFEVMWARHERGEKPGWFVINTIDLDSSGQ